MERRSLNPFRFAGLALVVSAVSCGGETPLQKAVKEHDAEAVERLLAESASTGRTLREPETAFELALADASSGEGPGLEIVRLFLAADPRSVDAVFRNSCRSGPCGDTSAIEIAVRVWNLDAVKLMIASGLTVSSQGTTDAVVYAVAEGNDETAKRLIEAGADPNGVASGGNRFGEISALEAAKRRENAAMVDWLVARGAR